MHMVSRIATFTTGAVMTAVAGYELAYKPWRQRWLASAEESATSLPGDELVPDADFAQTMAATIAAPPSAVWPWLLQMGYGRAGWYSYDAIDMLGHSARQIVPELQGLEVGQRVPVAPDIGFQVAVLEPERALVLYGDDELFGGQEPAEREGAGGRHADGETAGMRLAGVLSQASMREFRVSWAFALEPLEGDRTRLLERFRTRSTPGPAAALVRPIIDQGHFLMTRKQMLGIRERAEMLSRSTSSIGRGWSDVPENALLDAFVCKFDPSR
jgi:hypothetical protein